MFEVKQEIFQPLEKYQELKIHLVAPSHDKRLQAMADLAISMKHLEKGDEDYDHKTVMNNHKFEQAMIRATVKKVEGIKVGDIELKTADDLINHAPSEVMGPLGKKVLEMVTLPEEVEKKS